MLTTVLVLMQTSDTECESAKWTAACTMTSACGSLVQAVLMVTAMHHHGTVTTAVTAQQHRSWHMVTAAYLLGHFSACQDYY